MYSGVTHRDHADDLHTEAQGTEVNIEKGALYRVNPSDVVRINGKYPTTTQVVRRVKEGTISPIPALGKRTTKASLVHRNILKPIVAKPAILPETVKPSTLWKPKGSGSLRVPQDARLGIPGLQGKWIVKNTDSPHVLINTSKVTHTKGTSKIKMNNASKIELNKTSKCDMGKLFQNDTDVHNVVDVCNFHIVSQRSSVENAINRLSPVSLPLLPNYKSPCWYETLSSGFRMEYKANQHMFPDQAQRSFSNMVPILEKRLKEPSNPWRLRCLPLVYIIGVSKCGTSDLFETLVTHPHITSGATKEPFFWDWGRWNRNKEKLMDYLNLYDEAAENIRRLTEPNIQNGSRSAYHPMVTIDASVNTLFEFGGSQVLPGNVGHNEPRYIAAHMIKNLTPESDIKVILIVRNPTERLFSSYVFFNTVTHPSNISSSEFHILSSRYIKRFNRCTQKRTLTSCLYDEAVTVTTKTVDVHAGIYFGFVKDWIKVFPNMQVLTLEDYRINRNAIFNEMIKYIGLKQASSEAAESLNIVGKGPKQSFRMLPETKKLLDEFYRPFNKQLADLLKDGKFMFE